MNYLNLGCGDRFHPKWTNLDFRSTGEGVIACDLNQGIPFPDEFFAVVYHSHVLEHFPREKAAFLLQECYRVLQPGGILRIVIPDLEKLAQIYLQALELADQGSQDWAENYEWILIQLYDQAIRHTSGGEMVRYLEQEPIPNEAFILEFSGVDAKNLIHSIHQQRQLNQTNSSPQLLNRLEKVLEKIKNVRRYPVYFRELLLKSLLGKEYSTLQVGRFRQSGEVHQWMYDRYSLKQLLHQCGFVQVTQRDAITSYLENWTQWNLDTEPDGTIYKPDSLFMEAIK